MCQIRHKESQPTDSNKIAISYEQTLYSLINKFTANYCCLLHHTGFF